MKRRIQLSVGILLFFLIIAGCASRSLLTVILHSPPHIQATPFVNANLLEDGTSVTGSGVPHASVEVLLV